VDVQHDANVGAAFLTGKTMVNQINDPAYDISMACISQISLCSPLFVLGTANHSTQIRTQSTDIPNLLPCPLYNSTSCDIILVHLLFFT
jgi:hypothetical protein